MDARLAREKFCYLTTTGRRTGHPRRIEIWFAAADGVDVVYMLAGSGEAGWVRNLGVEPRVIVEVGRRRFAGVARVVTDPVEDATARRLVYQTSLDGLLESAQAAVPPPAVP